ncbi:AAA domain-containing protein [Saccharothrix saharensis]|uniref:AAA domain-containing protein n=1 Tax=Saccharothrix saharensis TaxID=571190 RepID=UPI003674EC37
MTVPAVLRTLARLSASEQPQRVQRVQLDLTKTAGLVWLGADDPAWRTLTTEVEPPAWTPVSWTPHRGQRDAVDRLASFDALHQEDRLLRLGWAFLCGPATVHGQRRRVCLPLVSRPVRLHPAGRSYVFHVAGDVAMFPLLADWSKAAELETRLARGKEWIAATLAASGFADVPVLGPERDPRALIGGDELVVVAGAGLHAGEPVVSTERGAALYTWARRSGVEATALAALYSSDEDATESAVDEVHGAVPLSPSQRAAVVAARTAPVTVVGGPPGSGKTHTLAAIALDAVASGRSVLLASRTRNAADVLGEALRRAGGPVPVLFGDSELRQEMARELSTGLAATSAKGELDRLDRSRRGAVAAVTRVERAVGAALRDEELVEAAVRFEALMPAHRAVAPLAFGDGVDFERLNGLLRPRHGVFGGPRTRWALRAARRLAGAADDVDVPDLEAAVRAAEQSAAQVRVAANGGTTLEALRGLLAEEDARGHAAIAAWLAVLVVSRRGAGPRRAVAALATALRSGRAARRRALTDVSTEHLVQALPLWVGTLADVEDILPAVPGMFDLVVIDEASHVDQPLAAPALLRGRRVVIGGDPRQLRHVSFVGEQAVREAVAAEGTVALADRLDVPKVSLFDAGAAAAGVHWLTEHHRCAPHLIGFAATRFYEGRISLLTTHPSIADVDCIDVEHVEGVRDDKGVNAVEVDAVLAHLRRRIAAGVRSIGVVTPFRAQADALEQALLDRLSLDEITTGGVRVGTVHGVQGSEFDEVVISLALTDADRPAAWRFANDPNLLAVLTTRARRLVHVITSAARPVGLIGDYLRHAEVPPTETEGVAPADEWTARLAAELTTLGLAPRTGYPVGRWRVDLVVGDRGSAVAVDTRPHPDGAAAHLARWRALRGAGWRVHDAFPSRFGHDPARAAVELARELAPRTAGPAVVPPAVTPVRAASPERAEPT